MNLIIKESQEAVIRNQSNISIIAKPKTKSIIIIFEPIKLSIKLEQNSELSLYIFYKNSKVKKQITIKENSKLINNEIIINSNIENQTKLIGKNAVYENKNLLITSKESSINTEIFHEMQQTKSKIQNRCLVSKNAITKCKGKIFIPKSSIECESHQKSEAIILDPTAKYEASPILEIFTDQVICSHSANISYINPEKLFYLNSRGLNENLAITLILEAFTNTILQEIPELLATQSKVQILEVLK
jgi:Fe-S cluster assembly scaffold protein SufB